MDYKMFFITTYQATSVKNYKFGDHDLPVSYPSTSNKTRNH